MATVVLFVPFAKFEWDPFIPVAFVGLAFLIRIGGPTIDILVRGPENIDAMLGHNVSYLVVPLVVVLGANVSFVLGFLSTTGEAVGQRLPRFHRWDVTRAHQVVIFYSLLGVTFYIYFLSDFEITSLADISAKRSFSGTAYVRFFARHLEFAAFLWFLTHLYQGKRLYTLRAVPMWTLVIIAMTYSVFSSTRGPIFSFVLMLLIVYHYYRSRIPVIMLSTLGIVSMVISGILLQLRALSNTGQVSLQLTTLEIFTNIFKANFGGVTVLAHIIHQFPAERPLRFGTTFFRWMLYPIPNFLQSDQPPTLSSELASIMYNRPNETPPMIIGELWMNYWLVGVIIGMLILGILARIVYEYLRTDPDPHIATVGMYAVFTLQFLFFTLTSTSSQMIEFMMWIVPTLAAILYISHVATEGGEKPPIRRKINIFNDSVLMSLTTSAKPSVSIDNSKVLTRVWNAIHVFQLGYIDSKSREIISYFFEHNTVKGHILSVAMENNNFLSRVRTAILVLQKSYVHSKLRKSLNTSKVVNLLSRYQ